MNKCPSNVKSTAATIRENLRNNLYEPDRLPNSSNQGISGSQPSTERVRQSPSAEAYGERLDEATNVARGSHRTIQDDRTAEPSAADLSGANGPQREAAAKNERDRIGRSARPVEEANLGRGAPPSKNQCIDKTYFGKNGFW